MSNHDLLATTATTVCCGILTVKAAVELIGVLTVLEGAVTVYTIVADFVSDEPIYRWGPVHMERTLKVLSLAGGVRAMMVGLGLLGVCCAGQVLHGSRRTRSIRLLGRGQGLLTIWTFAWALLVGVPVTLDYIEVPAVNVWPVRSIPGTPTKFVVNPDWPDGTPSVCLDVQDLKERLAQGLQQKNKKQYLRPLLKVVYRKVLQKVLKCETVVQYFWVGMLMLILFRAWCLSVLKYFHMIVLHGGDGVMIIGDLEDLEKPFHETRNHHSLLMRRIEKAFSQMDTDGDGKLSLQELLAYLEKSSEVYHGISEGKRRGRLGRMVS